MIVERKFQRDFWFGTIINVIPDLVIAAAIAFFFEGGVLLFVGALIGLQVVYFAVWIKNSIWFWTRFWFRDKKLIVRRLLDFLADNHFPKPSEFVESAESYLEGVASDDAIDKKTCILAATELGTLRYVVGSMRMQEYLRLTLCYDEAIEEYNRLVDDSKRDALANSTSGN